jgi:membrane-associated phospholipid phosphatase
LIPLLLAFFSFFLFYGKDESHQMINQWHFPIGDFVFKYATYLCDGVLFGILIFAFLFIRLKWALFFLASSLLTLFTVFVTKKIIFNGIPRPYKYFEGTYDLHLVDGVEMHSMNSFPSGHTITAFAIFMILIFIVKNRYLHTLFVKLAIIAGVSRVYLSQHFIIDVFFGAIIGICIAVLSCVLVDNLGICQGSWTEKSLIQIFDRKKWTTD